MNKTFVVFLVVVLLLGFIVGWIYQESRVEAFRSNYGSHLRDLEKEIDYYKEKIENLTEENDLLQAQHEMTLVGIQSLENTIEKQKDYIENLTRKYVGLELKYIELVLYFWNNLSFMKNVTVIKPSVDCDGIRINETTYRLHEGETLNFTFEFSAKGVCVVNFVTNYTDAHDINFTGIYDSYMEEITYLDDVRRDYAYHGFSASGVEGSVGHHTGGGGRKWSNGTINILSYGDHVLKRVYLFTVEGEAEGYEDINFLSEVVLTVVTYSDQDG